MIEERCSCGAREKNKCNKESEHKTGKMCLKELKEPKKVNWVEVDEKTAERLLKQRTEDSTLYSSNSLHCWDEVFTVDGCRFKVEGTFSSAKVVVYKEESEDNKAFDDLTEKLWKEHPEEMAEARVWAKEFINKQKCLGVEFEQVLADNLTNLYEN